MASSVPEQAVSVADVPEPPMPAPAEMNYRLQRGDVLDVKFFYAAELNESVVIRPDGRIALQLIGEVAAVDLTPDDLTQVLRQHYTGILVNPEITVIIRTFAGQKVYVGGEVTHPGLLAFDGRLTLLQALIQAGWLKQSATWRSVVLLRNTETNVPTIQLIDVRKQLQKPVGVGGEVVWLRPFDVVYVPQSAIAKANDFVEQYFDKLILTPVSRLAGFSFVHSLNNASAIGR